MLPIKGGRISQMARENCQGSSECPSAIADTLVALRGGIELPSEESRSAIALPQDSAIEPSAFGWPFARVPFDLLLLFGSLPFCPSRLPGTASLDGRN